MKFKPVLCVFVCIVSLLFFVSVSHAREFKMIPPQERNARVELVCIKGYVFVIARAINGIGIVQFFEKEKTRGGIEPPQPKKCGKNI